MAQRSPDPSTKVGAVLTRGDVVVGAGYNNLLPGIPEAWWGDRAMKYRGVQHAEVAAILSAGRMARGAAMYVTAHPCRECAKLIVAAGVSRVVCPAEPWRDDPDVAATCREAAELFSVCGVALEQPREAE